METMRISETTGACARMNAGARKSAGARKNAGTKRMDVDAATRRLNRVDAAFIDGLKRGDNEVCRRFFYKEIGGIIHKIRVEVFRGNVDFDELVSELYLFLSRDGWAKLDGFDGKNGCRLRTWMIPVAWRYLISVRERLLHTDCGDDPDYRLRADDDSADDDLRIQIAIDVNAVLAGMSNRRYAEIIRLLIVEGYGARDVADMLDMKVENVYNLKHRAIVQFIEQYGRR